MERLPTEEYERLCFFESARDKAAETYLHSPEDPDNLTRWGGALLELAQFQTGQVSLDMVEDAVSKLEEAQRINPRKPDTLWCLGNAHTTHGFLLAEGDPAKECFEKASECFEQALAVEPNNELFQKAMEMSKKAPALHQELQAQLTAQTVNFGPPTGASAGGHGSKSQKKKKKVKDNNLKYDLLGWVILAVGFFAWIGLSKAPPQAASESNLE